MRDPISLSPLGFGCAPVMGKIGKADALRAMATAFDLGVTHFDVARSYGFGRAEGVLGSFIKGKRDKVTVTTKFGVVPPELSLKSKVLIPIARQVTKFVPQLKARLKSKSGQLLAERNFDVAYARQCLDKSLKELSTDYIDIYLVHEPDALYFSNQQGIPQLMGDFIKAGKIRRWGYALHGYSDINSCKNYDADVLQFEGNISTLPLLSALHECASQRFVTRPFGGDNNMQEILALIQKLGLMESVTTIGAVPSDVALCISRALCGQNGTVLCSMFSSPHIYKNTQIVNRLENDPRMQLIVEIIFNTLANTKIESY